MNKLAIFKYATQFGGGEKYTQLLSSGIQENDITAALISNYSKLRINCNVQDKIYCRRLPEAKTRKEMLTLLFLWPIEIINYSIITLRLRLRGYRTILLQDLNEKLLLTPICRLFGIRVFWIEHTNWQPHLVKHPFFSMLKSSARLTSTIICPSRQLEKQINELESLVGKTTVIPHGVPKVTAQNRSRSARIVTLARLSHEKGVDLLIAAAAQLKDKPKIIIFGDGPEKTKLATEARRGGLSAVFKGHVSSPYAQISKSDLFVLPSRIENFPLSVLEALSAGLVIVAPDIAGVREILGDSGNFIFESGNIDDLKSKIGAALKLNIKDRQKLSTANQKLWQTRYNITAMVEKTITTISNLKP